MNRSKTLRLFYTVNVSIFLLLQATHAEAVCPACIAGAGFGVADAFVKNDMYKLGFWLAGFSYLAFRYVQTRLASRKYGTMSLILPSAFAALPLFYFTAGIAVIAGVHNVPKLNGSDIVCLFAAGSTVGSFTAFAGTVGTCVLKERYSVRIPFFRITAILTLLWLVSLISKEYSLWILRAIILLLAFILFRQELGTIEKRNKTGDE